MAEPSKQRRRLVGVSTKMYFGVQQTFDYVSEVLEQLTAHASALESIDFFAIPDFVSLTKVASLAQGTRLLLGAQDCHHKDSGAFTGEISAPQLREVGCHFVELGHAERRRLFGETDETVAHKAAAAARNGLVPLVCIGEQTEGPVQVAVAECTQQVESLLRAIPDDAEVVLAYEPVWAIGKSEPANAEHVVEVAQGLRRLTEGRRGLTRILYGGSAGPGLFAKLSAGVDGLFLGRFAHDPARFIEVMLEVAKA